MAIQDINIGSVQNDGTGDPLRTAFGKINDNFDELDTRATNAQDTADAAQSAADTAQAGADASVKAVNGIDPDSAGGVTLEPSDIGAPTTGALDALAATVGTAVFSVNAQEPDSSGNVLLTPDDIGSPSDAEFTALQAQAGSAVYEVNGQAPDSTGAVSLDPADIGSPSDADFEALQAIVGGAVFSVSGAEPDSTGNVAIGIPEITGLQSALDAREFISLSVYRSTNQTGIASGVETKVMFPNVLFDDGGYWDEVNSKVTLPAGKWLVSGWLTLAGSTTGTLFQGVVYLDGNPVTRCQATAPGSGGAGTSIIGAVEVDGTNELEIWTKQNSGSPQSLFGSGTQYLFVSFSRIGDAGA